MDFEITGEQEELRRSVRTVLEQECPTSVVRGLVETGRVPEQPWKSAVELGWPAICVPDSLGGLGLGFEELGLVLEEHGRSLAPGPFLATVTQFLPLVREAGSAAQQDRIVRAVVAGELRGALAIANAPGAGLLPDASLRARRDADGWLLEGSRHFVLDGDSADEVAVVARVEEGDGCGLFVLPRGSFEAMCVDSLDPSRPLANLAFEGVRVTPERALGEPGRCEPALCRALDEATVAVAIETVGTCQSLLDITLEHARQRVQFGRPIGAFQAVQHKCADMFVALEKARSTAYFAMMTIAEDDPRRRLAASMAKVAAGECQQLICKEAIQIHGGIGFTWESDVQLFVKRAKSGGALLGSADEHRARIAELLEL